MRVAIRASFSVLFILGVLAGCGQNGPLFLPGDASSIQVGTPPPSEKAEDSKEDDDKDRE